jgi:Lipase (class 3)
VDAAGQSTLGLRLPEAQLMAASYGLLGQGLTPALPDGFPHLPGFQFFSHLTVSDKILLGNVQLWKETSYIGLAATSDDEDLLVIVGTHNALEWIEDAVAVPRGWVTLDDYSCNVESGFAQVLGEITLQNSGMSLRSYVNVLNQKKRKLRILGHSLGAAVGGLVAGDAFFPHYTLFAMPLFSDIGLSKHIFGKADPASMVIRNVRDVVPIAPPFPLYQSVLTEAWFNSDLLGLGGSDAERHGMGLSVAQPGCYLKACLNAA